VRLYLEKNQSQKRVGGVAQGEGPQFKAQYHRNKQTNKQTKNTHRMGENLCHLIN
jgi:hypothetical protein